MNRLAPEFVMPQNGHDNRIANWLMQGSGSNSERAHYAARGVNALSDDLHCHRTFCEKALAVNAHLEKLAKQSYEQLRDMPNHERRVSESCLRASSDTLLPPKANEFDITAPISQLWRATFGTKSRSHRESGLSR